jgi:hypothetical protein
MLPRRRKTLEAHHVEASLTAVHNKARCSSSQLILQPAEPCEEHFPGDSPGSGAVLR